MLETQHGMALVCGGIIPEIKLLDHNMLEKVGSV
jgi:hypothetical protein